MSHRTPWAGCRLTWSARDLREGRPDRAKCCEERKNRAEGRAVSDRSVARNEENRQKVEGRLAFMCCFECFRRGRADVRVCGRASIGRRREKLAGASSVDPAPKPRGFGLWKRLIVRGKPLVRKDLGRATQDGDSRRGDMAQVQSIRIRSRKQKRGVCERASQARVGKRSL